MRVVLIVLKSHANISFHHSGNPSSVQVLQGSANFHSRNSITALQQGGLLTIHENVEHTLTANEESAILLTIAVCPRLQ